MRNIDIGFPLVSIVIITYNSSEYVLETLESAKVQTYKNIELIVTDDGSKDNTVDICREWINDNKNRFVRTELITTQKNTGTVCNANRGLNAAKGEWMKFIAGDDILIKTSINVFIEYCKTNANCKVVFGRIYYLKNNNVIVPKPIKKIALCSFKEQKRLVYLGSGLSAPALFINRNLLETFGGFDERYFLIEDVPLWIKIVNKNIQIFFIDNFVVNYRIHDDNVCRNSNKNHFFSLLFYIDQEKIILRELIPYYIKKLYIGALLHRLNYIIVSRFIILLGNKNNSISKFLNLFIIKTTIKKVFIKVRKLISNVKPIRN